MSPNSASGKMHVNHKLAEQRSPPKSSSLLNTVKSRLVTLLSAFMGVLFTLLVYHCYQRDLKESGSWGCEMSWMSPSYHLLQWHDNPIPRYQVYHYREQGLDIDSTLAGHPVVFIPGNAGSYQQVRSIASSAARQYQEGSSGEQGIRRLDFFTIDFNEDFSAFSGRTLSTQAEFIKHSVRRILDEYDHLPAVEQPRQVTLLAHSMGGIAARLAVAERDIGEMVDMIITMSTPHITPPLTIEWDMERIYRTISHPVHPLLISLCGGISDTQVVSDSCALPSSLVSESDGFATFTTGIPGAWTGVDHQAMVWCHQVRWLIAKALIETAAASNRSSKLSIARRWFSGQSIMKPSQSNTYNVSVTSTNMTILAKPKRAYQQTTFTVKHCTDKCREIPFGHGDLPFPKYVDAPFPLPGEGVKPEETLLFVDVDLQTASGFLFVASESHEVVEAGSREVLEMRTSVWSESRQSEEWANAVVGAGKSAPFRSSLLLHFSNFRSSSLLVHRLKSTVRGKCNGVRPILQHISVPAHHLKGATTESRSYPHLTSNPDIYLHSHIASLPFQSDQRNPHGMTIRIFQQPDCPLEELKMTVDPFGILAKIVTRYRMILLSWPLAWVAAGMLMQTQWLKRDGHLISFDEGIEQVGRRWLAGCCLALGIGNIVQFWFGTSLRLDTLLVGTTDLAFLPLVIIMALWTYALTCGAWLLLRFTNSILSIAVLKVIGTRSRKPNDTIDSHSHPSRLIILACLVMLLVYLFIPHQLAFIVSVVVLWTSIMRNDWSEPSGNLGESTLFLMLFLIPFKATTLLVWGRSLWMNWKHPLSTDHNILYIGPAVLLVALCVRGNSPQKRDTVIQLCRFSLFCLSATAFLFGVRWTWILPPMAHAVLLTLAGVMI
ncbi:hypothetical protein I302_101011 [Kwoniella bestiolae CBS 10118]|uniref:GPI inositol-deacylase n=1 Tax=Kwoniella bestiolae CBS 10118 TaxID=1296100 RepID=A0AAJ8M507_9TREE